MTRALGADDPTRRALEAEGYEVSGHSLLSFVALPHEDPPPSDWVFFYSRRGVRHLSPGAAAALARAGGPRIGAMGPGTASALRARGLRVDFVGDGDPASTADLLRARLIDPAAPPRPGERPRVCFVQARNSRASVMRLLGDAVAAHTLNVYASAIDPSAEVPQADVYWPTSPLNAEATVRRLERPGAATWWAIGPSTAERLRELVPGAPVALRALAYPEY